MPDFKPNIMPIMYWSLAYGAAAGVLLFIVSILSRYLLVAWFPVFLAGVIWGGWRNYQRQKQQWYDEAGVAAQPQSVMSEFKQAASDIASEAQELLNQEDTSEPTPPAPPEESDQSLPPTGR